MISDINTPVVVSVTKGAKVGTIYHLSSYRMGKVMYFSATITTTSSISPSDILFSGLPKPKSTQDSITFIGTSLNPAWAGGFHVGSTGSITMDGGAISSASNALCLACTYIIDEQ